MLIEKFQTDRSMPEILPKAQYPLRGVKEILKSLRLLICRPLNTPFKSTSGADFWDRPYP